MNRLQQQLEAFVEKCREEENVRIEKILQNYPPIRAYAEFSDNIYNGLASLDQPAVVGEEPTEIESVIACLDDDAAKILQINPDDEIALNMQTAANLLEKLAAPSTEAVEQIDERAEFEKWAKINSLYVCVQGDAIVYKDDELHIQWEGWQARSRLGEKK
jgi:hypothetical protein